MSNSIAACGNNRSGECDIPVLEENQTYTQVAAGGDHTVQHNDVRNIVHSFCLRARFSPEKEASGILANLPNPENRRRPADVLICSNCFAFLSVPRKTSKKQKKKIPILMKHEIWS